ALINKAGTDGAQGWRLSAREIENAVITILIHALSSPTRLLEWFGTAGMPSDQIRRLLARGHRLAAALGGSPGQRAMIVREFVEKVIVDDQVLIIQVRRGAVCGGAVPSCDIAKESRIAVGTPSSPVPIHAPTGRKAAASRLQP